MAMWRRPHWQTLFLLLAVLVIGGQLFIGRMAPSEQRPCLRALPETVLETHNAVRGEGRLSLSEETRVPASVTSQSQPARRPSPLEAPEEYNKGVLHGPLHGPVGVRSWGRHEVPGQEAHAQRAEPVDFILISEMNSTIHAWPWPDSETTQKVCSRKDWRALGALPDVSIIVSFCNNEDIFNLLHTLHAIVKRSPSNLLREIILIDDNTSKDEFVQVLEIYIQMHFRSLVRLMRSKVDLGIIGARLTGIRAARGRVVVVFDSHVEPQKDWLEPILYEIVKNRRTLASPYLDWMEKQNRVWNYRHGASSWKTYFDWSLTFGFQALSNDEMQRRTDPTQPVRSAVTVGTWGMDKAWFEEVGAFDDGMLRWGGENIDLAVRVWLFGGQVVNIPCSHVAHLEKEQSRAYRNSWTGIIQKNYKRFVEVWLDDYKKYFYQHLPHIKFIEVGNLGPRLEIKSRAIHNFSWFLENAFPELGIPDVNVFAYGGLQSLAGGCFDTMFSVTPTTADCNPALIATQGLFWNKKGLLRLPINIVTSHVTDESGSVRVYEYTGYHNTGQASVWFHIKDGPIIETASGLCLTVKEPHGLILTKCRATSLQYWRFRVYSQDYNQLAYTTLPAFKQYIPLLASHQSRATVNVFELQQKFLGKGTLKK